MARLLLSVIHLYQRWVSPMLGNVCRFEPSCSRYAASCIETHGAARGSWLAAQRLCKCHPFHPGGNDPPPPRAVLGSRQAAPPEQNLAQQAIGHSQHG